MKKNHFKIVLKPSSIHKNYFKLYINFEKNDTVGKQCSRYSIIVARMAEIVHLVNSENFK